jgi:hypothetical protein
MPVLLSNIFNGTVTGTQNIIRQLPSLVYTTLTPGSVISYATGVYSEGGGTIARRWGTEESGVLATGAQTFTLTADRVSQHLYVEEQPFNTSGYPIRWVRSPVVFIPEAVDDPGEWVFAEDTTLVEFPRPRSYRMTFVDDILVSLEETA